MIELSSPNAFHPGHHLWILPPLSDSAFTQKIDWYLNFIMTRASLHEARKLSQKIQSILQATEIPEPTNIQSQTESLLIPSHQFFPNQWVLIQGGAHSSSQWVKAVYARWVTLQKPSVRIFLPKNLNKEDFLKLWTNLGGDEELSVVTATTPLV